MIQKNKIYADWWEFAKQLDTSFDKSSSEELKNACNYIESQPPLKFNGITWQSIDLKNNICTCEKLIRYIQTIRNNLFHGGKNPFDTIRDSKLINSSLIILDYCISISPHNIKTAFWSGLTAPEI